MAAYFLDTSGLAKRYLVEIGTGWVQAIMDPAAGNTIYLARISAVELVSAVTRRQRGGHLTVGNAAAILARFRLDFSSQYRILEISTLIYDQAMLLAESHGLRAYDAIQLAVAVEVDSQRRSNGLPPATFISADKDLNAAALASGLLIDDPNLHP